LEESSTLAVSCCRVKEIARARFRPKADIRRPPQGAYQACRMDVAIDFHVGL
jgi:hypothetical protein